MCPLRLDQNKRAQIAAGLDAFRTQLAKVEIEIGRVGAIFFTQLSSHNYASLLNNYMALMHVNEYLNRMMTEVGDFYDSHLANDFYSRRQRNQWLQVEVASRKAKARKIYHKYHKHYEYIETLLYWRIGTVFEKREYKYSLFSGSKRMHSAFFAESPSNRKCLLAFDYIFSALHQMRKKVRSIDLLIIEKDEELKSQSETLRLMDLLKP